MAIKNCDGIQALVRLLRKCSSMEVKELVTGTLWNLSSHEPLKMMVINNGLQTLTDEIIIPHSGWRKDTVDPSKQMSAEWTTVFKNTSGCLRNVSSDGAEARQRLRECEGLVDALLHALQSAVVNKDTDNKSVENCVCILRNLSYHVHKEIPGMERFQEPHANHLMSHNHNTLEAAAGALQNLAAGQWAWSSYIRATVRKEKGLPILVELLRSDVDKVVRAVAIALRNLAMDRRNKDLIARETKAASHVLQTIWAYKDLRNTLNKAGWNKSHFKPTTTGVTKKSKGGKQGGDDITLPLMDKNQDVYSSLEPNDRVGDGKGPVAERDALQATSERKHFIRAGRPAVGLMDNKPPPLDSWV
ncbi:Armadillo repeat protein deleted in velo-cardio-facial syndrome [Collichthys lucidus]|uniref:Armadillo repeat protein deleted in velo-cardio-facial syndrome n=1 Tax=Collichthys lucidus TaxID=240159 RepID=A0A4U5V912_COLLU|nr:Armadillo repeat protein deleted in velo-cardio-facial syndrome [Collichthys lucidus]